ncbi:MAG: PAS domain-containing protein [Pseudomonadota bacterium]
MASALENLLSPFGTSLTAVSVADADGPDMPLLYVNSAFETLTGYRSGDVLGRNCRFLQGPQTEPDAHERIRSALTRRQEISICLLNYTAQGTAFHNLLILTPIQDASGRNLTLGCQYDLNSGRQQTQIEDHLRDVDGVISRLTFQDSPTEPWRQSLKSMQMRSDSIKMLAYTYLRRMKIEDLSH